MLRQILPYPATAALVLLLSAASLADTCASGCPALPNAPLTANVGGNTGSVQNSVSGVSQPTAAIINQNENFQQQGQFQRGPNGCSDTRVSLLPSIGYGTINGPGYSYGNLNIGVAAVIPIGRGAQSCDQYFKTTIKMHENDERFGNAGACLGLVEKATALRLEPNRFIADAGLGAICPAVTAIVPPPPVIVAPAPPVAPLSTPRPVRLSNFAPRCDAHLRKVALDTIHARRGELKTKHPSQELSDAQRAAYANCATVEQVTKALDG